MKYTNDERMDIGRQVYTHELSHNEAMQKYGVGSSCIDNYVRMYKMEQGIPTNTFISKEKPSKSALSIDSASDIETYMSMSKEELINELIKAKANELRAKKGYEVKGAGANKEFIPLNRPNSKS